MVREHVDHKGGWDNPQERASTQIGHQTYFKIVTSFWTNQQIWSPTP